eukprot:TRINITY_DN52982_c0_g1_i1.p3 TRINITY_DN52982_c0_g1~~TRINITY_DN52982_c0_g1_i1.p3  ORF type:complete len:113 (-),score=26.77 TRINITY_DN52982_c0_g1_i1:176-514(-)
MGVCFCFFGFFFFSSRRRHTRCREVSWARRCVQETEIKSCSLEAEAIVFSWKGFHIIAVIFLLWPAIMLSILRFFKLPIQIPVVEQQAKQFSLVQRTWLLECCPMYLSLIHI